MRPRRHAFTLLLALPVVAVVAGPAGAAGGVVTVREPRPVTRAAAPAEGSPALSGDGRFVAYQVRDEHAQGTKLRLVRRDLSNGTTTVLNRRADGAVVADNYSEVVLSASGDRAAFIAARARLVSQDLDARPDAYVRDAGTATTTLVSGADGSAGTVALSDDGRWAAFTSTGTDLVPGSRARSGAYLRDLTTGAVHLISLRPDGSPSRGIGTTDVDVDAAGRFVAFLSYATDLGVGDGADGEQDLFLRDTATATTTWLSREAPAGAAPSGVTLSPDHRWVATRYADGSLRLIRTSDGHTELVAPDATAAKSAFSTDGRLLAYTRSGQAYVRDLVTGTDTSLRTPAGGTTTTTTLSGNGRAAAYDWHPTGDGPSRILLVHLSRS